MSAANETSPSNAGLYVGAKVRLLKDIWDDGEDHHPPGYLALKGEVLIVRRAPCWQRRSIGVSHEHITDNSFTIYAGEYETYNAN